MMSFSAPFSKKSQAAMEFLMTYGWAILAAIIAIGVLAYFGVFNPSRLAGSTAVLNAPLNIPSGGFNIVNNGADCGGNDCISIQATQNVGQSITVSAATITLTSGAAGICADTTALPSGWQSGTSQTLNLDCGAAAFAAGDSIAGNIQIQYTVGTSGLTQSSTGNVRGVVQ